MAEDIGTAEWYLQQLMTARRLLAVLVLVAAVAKATNILQFWRGLARELGFRQGCHLYLSIIFTLHLFTKFK